MQSTPYAEVNDLLDILRSSLDEILSGKLVGLYAFGSLVTGEFDPDLSDIDLAAAIAADLDDTEYARLETMHAAIAQANPRWDDRIEVGYISVELLRSFDPRDCIAVISPGEPFHRRAANDSWLFNLRVLREHGLTLSGPPPRSLISPIASDDLARALGGAMRMWRAWLPDAEPVMHAKPQAYVILTMCRALYAHQHAAFVSKREAARWAAPELPEWSSLIRDALAWYDSRQDMDIDLDATRTETLRFTRYVTGRIINDND
ncbi:MAG: DUF4111 domain-containing protein [Chloroflexia bacterium]|nr:DUF4111 domain-containing protein [Chloroflexia bacterium]